MNDAVTVHWQIFDAICSADDARIAQFVSRISPDLLISMDSGPDMGQVTVWYRDPEPEETRVGA